MAANRKQFESMDDITIDRLEPGMVGEVEVVHSEFHGRIGKMRPIHCLQVMYLYGDRQVIVTATTSPAQWPKREPALRALMAGIEIAPR